MDTYPVPPRPAQSFSGRTTALIGIILIIGIVGYAAYHFHSSKGHESLIPNGAVIVLGANTFPPHQERLVDLTGNKLVLFAVPGQGAANISSVASTSKHMYYLISGPAAGQTTLYQLDLSHPKIGLAQLTTSKSLKVDLSVNKHEDFAVFAAQGSSSSPDVIVLNLETGKEKNLGEGVHPVMLPDGSAVIAERAGAFVLIDIRTGVAHDLVKKVPVGSPVALSNSSWQLAFYDASANVLHTYQIQSDRVSVRDIGTSVPGERPQGLFYIGKNLYMARMLPDTLVLSTIDATRDIRIAAPGFSLDGFNLTAL